MKSTKPDTAPLRTVEITTKVVLDVGDEGEALQSILGEAAMNAMLRGDTVTFTPYG
jgi:hypothetical protein